MGSGYDLHPDGQGFRVSDRSRGLGQPKGPGVKESDHPGDLPCGRCASGSLSPPWHSGNREHGSRQSVYGDRACNGRQGQGAAS